MKEFQSNGAFDLSCYQQEVYYQPKREMEEKKGKYFPFMSISLFFPVNFLSFFLSFFYGRFSVQRTHNNLMGKNDSLKTVQETKIRLYKQMVYAKNNLSKKLKKIKFNIWNT